MFPLMKYINRTSRCAVIYRNHAFESLGIYDHQHAYLIHICNQPGIRQDELSQLIHVNKSNVARQLAQLETKGYITREVSTENRRLIHLFPTEKGLEIFPTIKEALFKWNQSLLADFSDEEQLLLEKLLIQIAKKADEQIGGNL